VQFKILIVSTIFLFQVLSAHAQHSDEETAAFFAQIRQEKVDFNRALSAETDSKAAAIADFIRKEQAERIAFARSSSPGVSLDQFNAAALQKRQDFYKKLKDLPKNKLEKAIDQKDMAARIAIQNDIAARRKQFELNQQKKVREFINS
jgi:hypothetical protein